MKPGAKSVWPCVSTEYLFFNKPRGDPGWIYRLLYKAEGKKKIKQGLKSPVWSDSLFWDFLGFGDPKLTEFQASTSSRSLNRGATCTSDFVSQTRPTQTFLSAYGSSPWINHSSLTLGIENWFGDGVRTRSAQHQLHPSNSEALQLQHPLITAK